MCRRDGRTYERTELYGDIDLIPSGMSSSWEASAPGSSLILRVPQNLLSRLAEASDLDPDRVRLSSLFGVRDLQLQHIALALKSESDAGWPGGDLFADALGTALAARLLRLGESPPVWTPSQASRTDGKRVRSIVQYIEENLESGLGLPDIAAAGGLSVSNLKTVFRHATGQSVYQYVIQRRVALAERLLRESDMPISEVALAAGFSHHSHLARHLRRWRGTTASVIRNGGP
jgi:AraC family transcriptional regulator